tara:strand:- start:4368 stop:5087 length:720 start_codon:yes stop_codon:yes gene_type:complete
MIIQLWVSYNKNKMEDKNKLMDLLNKHEPFKENIQKKVGRDRAVVYAVHLLEINNIEATFQRICICAFKLFPESFAFVEFPEFPDSRIVRNCLWHCVHKAKEWLIGSDKTHYNTTEKGKDIVNIFQRLLKNKMDLKSLPYSLQIKGLTKKEMTTKSSDKEVNYLNEIKNSKAYSLFKTKKEEIQSNDIKKSLGGDRYSSSPYLKDKLSKALDYCKLINEKNVESYLKWIKKNWIKLMGE